MPVLPTKQKIAYLDGLRGLAALLVFFHHFLLVFYPAYYNGDIASSHLNGWDVKYGKSIFSVFTNGDFCVCVFFVLSGFVLSRRYFNDNKIATLVSGAHRRFLRLYIPVAFTLILSYVLIKTHCYLNVPVSKLTHSETWFGGLWIIDFPTRYLLKCLFCSTLFNGEYSLDTTMWTMSIEFYSSFIVFAFLALTHEIKRRYIMLILMLVFCVVTGNAYLSAFILGISLNIFERHQVHLSKRVASLLVMVLLLSGLIMGSFPSNNITNGTFFSFMAPWANSLAGLWFHNIAAFFVVLSFVLSTGLQHIISLRFFRFLGYISFSIYLLHPLVLGSFSSYVFLHIYGHWNYSQSAFMVLLSTVALCFVLSWLMAKYIDDNGIRLSRYIYMRYIKKGEMTTN